MNWLKEKCFSWHQIRDGLKKRKFVYKYLIYCNHFTASSKLLCAEAQHAVLSSLCPCFPRVQKFLLKSGSFPPSRHLYTLLLLSQPLLHLTVFCGSVFLILNKTLLLATHARLCLYNGRLEDRENSVSRFGAQSCWAATAAGRRWGCTGTGEGGVSTSSPKSTRCFVHHFPSPLPYLFSAFSKHLRCTLKVWFTVWTLSPGQNTSPVFIELSPC